MSAADGNDLEDYTCDHPFDGWTGGSDQIWEIDYGDAIALQVADTGPIPSRMVVLEGGCDPDSCFGSTLHEGIHVDITDSQRRFVVFEAAGPSVEPDLLVFLNCFYAETPEEPASGCAKGTDASVVFPLLLLLRRPRWRRKVKRVLVSSQAEDRWASGTSSTTTASPS